MLNGRLSNVADGKIATGMADPYGLVYVSQCCRSSTSCSPTMVTRGTSSSGSSRLAARALALGWFASSALARKRKDVRRMTALALLYVAEEDVGLWRYSAAADGGSARTSVDTVANGHLTDDAEGVTIFYGPGQSGYLIVSSQGSNDYNVYQRDGDNKFIGKFAIVLSPAGIDGTSDTDGIDVTSTSLGSAFPAWGVRCAGWEEYESLGGAELQARAVGEDCWRPWAVAPL